MATNNPLHKTIQRIAQTRMGAALFSKTAHLLDRPIISLTNGRSSAVSLLAGLPVVSLTTIGRKSGKKRTVPLIGIPDGEKVVLIGSNFGGEKNPGWYFNLKANPEAELLINGRSQTYTAHQAHGAERQRYWELATKIYLGYTKYEKWADHRNIPVMVLTPTKLTIDN